MFCAKGHNSCWEVVRNHLPVVIFRISWCSVGVSDNWCHFHDFMVIIFMISWCFFVGDVNFLPSNNVNLSNICCWSNICCCKLQNLPWLWTGTFPKQLSYNEVFGPANPGNYSPGKRSHSDTVYDEGFFQRWLPSKMAIVTSMYVRFLEITYVYYRYWLN